mgnify:FL=1
MSARIKEKQSGMITSIDYRRKSVKIGYWLMFIGLIALTLIAVIPVVWTFLSGFKEPEEYYSSMPTFFPAHFDLSKIKSILVVLKLNVSVVNSLIMFAGVWFATVVIGGIAGYTISRLKPKGSALLFRVIFWMMLMPNTLSLVPSFLMWTDFPIIHLNFQNTFLPFWLGGLCNAFDIMLFKNFFDNIPDSFIEAAKIDGCSNAGIFSKIVVPLSKPIISTVTIFVFQATWNNFMGPFLYLKAPNLATVALKLYKLAEQYTVPEQMLGAFILMIPTMLIYVICSRQILSNGMSAGIKE